MNDPERAKLVGEAVRELRNNKKDRGRTTQAELHQLTGIGTTHISWAERGGASFSRDELIKIGLILGDESTVAQLLKMAEMEPLISDELSIYKKELVLRYVSKPDFEIPHNHLVAVGRMKYSTDGMFVFLNDIAKVVGFPLSIEVCQMLLCEREKSRCGK